jgi:hypothetical protein
MKFSQRIGKKAAIKQLQLESMDSELKIGLWNIIMFFIIDKIPKYDPWGNLDDDFKTFSKFIWHEFYKLPIDTITENPSVTINFIREKYFKFVWYEVYDFVEYLNGLDFIQNINLDEYSESINNILAKEFSGYRFVSGKIAPISNKIEIDEIELAIDQAFRFTSLKGANIHLNNALEKLSDKINPDFRNSIKESISSVETACRILTGENTLGNALNALESKGIKINEQLKKGFERIYAFTNNKQSGIRHAIIENYNDTDFDDAKYMLVACSSFINFLIGKCKTLKIEIE